MLLIVTVLFSCTVKQNVLTEQEKLYRWKLLFDGQSLNGWKNYNAPGISGWAVEDGCLADSCIGGDLTGYIITEEQYDNFELAFDWKIAAEGNSGVMYHVIESEKFKTPYMTGPEYQLLVIEIKCGKEIFPELQKVIKKYWRTGNIAFIAFNFETISLAKSNFPEVLCYYLSSSKDDILKKIPDIKKNKLDGVDLNSKIIDQQLVDELHKANAEIWCWTVDALDETIRMKDPGVNVITTNRPTWLKEQMVAKSISAK